MKSYFLCAVLAFGLVSCESDWEKDKRLTQRIAQYNREIEAQYKVCEGLNAFKYQDSEAYRKYEKLIRERRVLERERDMLYDE